jgi:glucose dehydrogenase
VPHVLTCSIIHCSPDGMIRWPPDDALETPGDDVRCKSDGGRRSQYLVIKAGGHHFMETPIGDALVAYALPH